MNALRRVLGQSCWLDDLGRHTIRSGELARLAKDGVRGVISNPAMEHCGISRHAIEKKVLALAA